MQRYSSPKSTSSTNATTELIPSTGSAYSGVIEQYRDVRAFVLAQRPPAGNAAASALSEEIRVIGQAPIVRTTIFDMVADNTEFRIFIPSKKKFIVGPTRLERRSEKPIENLRPQHLLEALFIPAPQPAGDLVKVLLEENEFGGRRYYAVTQITALEEGPGMGYGIWHVARKWWFERSRLELVRVQRFESDGRLVADIHYDAWSQSAGQRYPHTIELVRPQEDYRLKLLVKELTLNEPIPAEKFRLEKPAGVELVQLSRESAAAQKELP